MESTEAVFMAIGRAPTVLDLADQLSGELQQRRCIGDAINNSEHPAAINSIAVKLPLSEGDDDLIFAQTERWLERHESVLSSTEARKIIEFQTFLDPNTGSRILTIPNTIVRICGTLGLDVANQATRVLTTAEYDIIRGNVE